MRYYPAWSQAERDRLAQMWATGLSTRLMAETLGCTKNAIVGHAHRMGLERRPSPIRREPSRAVMSEASALALAGRGVSEVVRLAGISEHFAQRVVRAAAEARPYVPKPVPSLSVMPPPVPVVVEAPEPALEPVVRRTVPTSPCCWPIGKPGCANFRFCDTPTSRRKPYCPEHTAVAYVRPSRDAAA